jgi:hypothetical protein
MSCFRTGDALSVAYADIFYMRLLQMKVLSLAKAMNPKLVDAQVGKLNMYFCRSYIPRKAKNKRGTWLDGLKAAYELLEALQH